MVIVHNVNQVLVGIVHIIGKSESYIRNSMRLMDLPEAVQTMVKNGELSATHARTIAVAENPTKLAQEIISNKLTVAATDKLVKNAKRSTHRRAYTAYAMDSDTLRKIEKNIKSALKVPAKIIEKRGGAGRIVLEYSSRVELDELLKKLTN